MPAVDQHHRDVLPGQDVLEQGQRLRLRHLVRPRSVGVLGVPVHEVHVQVHAAEIVFVVLTVPVVVDTLDVEDEPGPLALVPIRLDVEPRLVGVLHPVGLGGIEDAHHRDQAVAVEVVGWILVQGAVTVAVVGAHRAPPLADDVGEEPFRRVGVDARHDVHRVLAEERPHGLVVRGGLFQQRPGNGHGDGAAEEVIAVDVRHQEQCRAAIGINGAGQCQAKTLDVATFPAGADRRDGARRGMVLSEPVDLLGELRMRQVSRVIAGTDELPRQQDCQRDQRDQLDMTSARSVRHRFPLSSAELESPRATHRPRHTRTVAA